MRNVDGAVANHDGNREVPLGRRQAVGRLGGLAVVAALGCHGVRRVDLPADDASAAPPPAPDASIRRVLGYAALASSAHNSQPWRVRPESADRLVLLRDVTRRLPAVDPADRELMLSLGAFLENLAQAGTALGLPCDIVPVEGETDEVATIHLGAAAPGPTARRTLDAISRRRILRSGYRDEAIASDHVAAMLASAGEARFYARGSREWSLLRDGTIAANRLQAARDDAQRELASWIRWRDDEARTKRDGLTPESLEIGGVAGWWVRRRYTSASVMSPAFRKRGVETAERQASAGGGWLVLTGSGTTRASLLDAGRRYERLLLSLRGLGIAAHPMTQILEEAETRRGLEASLGVSETIQFLLRVGYVERYPEPVSVRRPIDWFLV